MQAARLHEYGKPLVIDDVPKPTPGPGQVVIRVEGAGFCHSDLHIISGDIRVLPRMPLTLGHENAGTVSAIGGGVHAVKEGDRVAVYGGWGDGFCDYCVAGEENLCPTMQWVGLSQHEGGYAEYLLVPHERYLVKLNTLEPKAAAPLTDAALTPYRAIKRALPHVRPDYPVLVIGCGALGQFGVKILRLLSGAEIIAVDLDDGKLKIARESGATHAINARDPEVAQKIRRDRPRNWCLGRLRFRGGGQHARTCDGQHADGRSRGSGGPRGWHRARRGTQDRQAGSLGVSVVVGQHP